MLNDAKPIVPPMKNVVGNTHAETRAEIEARARAEAAAQAAMYAAAQEEAKKSPWPGILIAIFAFIALAAAGFAVYEYTEIDKLKQRVEAAEASLSEEKNTNEILQVENEALKTENEHLRELLKPEEETEETTDETPEETKTTE